MNSSNNNKDLIYVTHTCKNCKCAFMDVDRDNAQDLPPTNRYCPECVKNGFLNKEDKEKLKNKKKRKLSEETIKKNFIKNSCKENNITEKSDISFITKTFNRILKTKQGFNERIVYRNIFKNAMEILNYEKLDKNN